MNVAIRKNLLFYQPIWILAKSKDTLLAPTLKLLLCLEALELTYGHYIYIQGEKRF